MSLIIRKQIEGKELTEIVCQSHGLKRFDQSYYKKVNILGKGSFGEVWKCLEITKREMVAVKYIKVKEVKDREKKISFSS